MIHTRALLFSSHLFFILTVNPSLAHSLTSTSKKNKQNKLLSLKHTLGHHPANT